MKLEKVVEKMMLCECYICHSIRKENVSSSFNGSFDMIVAHSFGFSWIAHHFCNVYSTMKEWHESITSVCTVYAYANTRLIRLQT